MKALRLLPLLAACEVGPNYVKPQLPTPPAFAETGSTAHGDHR
jgi:hypothetical protein